MKQISAIALLLVATLVSTAQKHDTGYLVCVSGVYSTKCKKTMSPSVVDSIAHNYFKHIRIDSENHFKTEYFLEISDLGTVFYAEKKYFIKKKNGKIRTKKIKKS